jgi:ribose transport system substrate-binding protein
MTRGPTIGVLVNIGSHAWYVRQIDAERRVGRDRGVEIIVRDAEDDPNVQNNQVIELLRLGCSALIVSAVRSSELVGALDACAARGVPVIAESIPIDHSAVVAQLRVDNRAAGVALGDVAGTALAIDDDRPPLVHFVGFAHQSDAPEREQGFLLGLRRAHPNVEAVYLDGRAQVAMAREVTAMFLARPHGRRTPDVLFGVDDESIVGARQAFDDASVSLAETIVATFGVSPPQGMELLDTAQVDFGLAMFPEWHGRVAVELATDAIAGRSINTVTHPPFAIVGRASPARPWTDFYGRSATGDFVLREDVVRSLRN